jgi:colanic acid/amylovoran biosynthesis protein
LLVHEKKDGGLAVEVKEKSGLDMRIIEEDDPLLTKGIIGASFLVVGSRYHGLVSALSQGVPTVATGWSHKYQLLYDDYGCKEFLISDLDFQSRALPRLQQLMDEDRRKEIVEKIAEKATSQVHETEMMWQEVLDLICPAASSGRER